MMRAGRVLAVLAFVAGSAQAQASDTTTAHPDTGHVAQLQTITVTAERPHAAAPPVTTLTVPPAVLRRTFASDASALLRRTSVIDVHEHGPGTGSASDAVVRGF